MKKILPKLFIILLILAGLISLRYPTISNWMAERRQLSEIVNYSETVAEMNVKAITEEREKAKEYNDALSGANIKGPVYSQQQHVPAG